MSETISCRGLLLQETPKAIKVGEIGTPFHKWIPRSVITYMHKQPITGEPTIKEIRFKVQAWFARKEGLDHLEHAI